MATVTVPDESAIACVATAGAVMPGNVTVDAMGNGTGAAGTGSNGTTPAAAFTPAIAAGAGGTPVGGAGGANNTNAAAVPGLEAASGTGTSLGPGTGAGEGGGSGAGASASVLAQLDYGNSTTAASTFGLQSAAPFPGAAASLRSTFVGIVFIVIIGVMVS